MNYSKRSRMGLAVGLFLVLSMVVFGTIFYVCMCANNVEIVASEDGARNRVFDGVQVDDDEYVVSSENRIRRGDIELVPDSNRYPGIRIGPIEIVPEYNPFVGYRRGPIMIVPW